MTPWAVAHQSPLSIDFPGKNTVVGCPFLFQGIFLAWVALSYSRGSSWPRNRTGISCTSCFGWRTLHHYACNIQNICGNVNSFIPGVEILCLLILSIFLKNELLGVIVSLLLCRFSISVIYILIFINFFCFEFKLLFLFFNFLNQFSSVQSLSPV